MPIQKWFLVCNSNQYNNALVKLPNSCVLIRYSSVLHRRISIIKRTKKQQQKQRGVVGKRANTANYNLVVPDIIC